MKLVPTHEELPEFRRDWRRLPPEQRAAFLAAVVIFVADLESAKGFRKSLRVKRVRATADIWELTWVANGRATWQFGKEIRPGVPNVIWRRIGTHAGELADGAIGER